MNLEDLTLLYAEDENGIRDTVTDVLELYVNNVITASNGEEALEYYHLYKPQILLLDICMPKKNGLDVLKEIRKTDLQTPVIIMTAHTEQKYLMSAVELYITKYLIKPFNKTNLLEALDECLKLMSKQSSELIVLKDAITYDKQNQSITNNGKVITLNKKETKLLNLLLKNAPNVISYENIEYHIWEDLNVTKEAFKSLIKDLRKKTSKDLIRNISGTGYKIDLS
ncbi:MAG: response regulator transcription factor [Campylobacteraceae bacterium]|nr:response regulator transcription factor [Campylobacteraceae bacterium]